MGEQPVPTSIVSAISGAIDAQEVHKKVTKNFLTDETICTRRLLKEALKSEKIKGGAFVEWEDDEGKLRVNVIDFLTQGKFKAVDPSSGQVLKIEAKDIPDDTWRVVY
jgi:hypothetical protein